MVPVAACRRYWLSLQLWVLRLGHGTQGIDPEPEDRDAVINHAAHFDWSYLASACLPDLVRRWPAEEYFAAVRERHIPAVGAVRAVSRPITVHDDLCSNRQ